MALDSRSPAVVAENLSKTYRTGQIEVAALISASITVADGEFVAIMGPSGSGKSTLLHLVGGLDVPTSGTVVLAGQRISGLSDKHLTLARRQNVGFVFQFFNLLPTLTAEENIALPLILAGRERSSYQTKIDELLKVIGLADRRTHRPDHLSGGEQQRVAVARALVTDPAVVLADEPTGNLDTKTGADVLRLLEQASSRFKRTVIMVTHDPKAAASADRVVFLGDGRVVDHLALGGEGDTEAIMASLQRLSG